MSDKTDFFHLHLENAARALAAAVKRCKETGIDFYFSRNTPEADAFIAAAAQITTLVREWDARPQDPTPPWQKPTFAAALEAELTRRYDLCQDYAATPCNILLAVANAVAAAREASE